MRLVRVVQVSFNRSEETNFNSLKMKLEPGQCVCLHSMTGKQVMFIYKPMTLTLVVSNGERVSREYKVLRSQKLRLLEGEEWNEYMIGNYAKRAGLDIANLLLIQQHLVRIRKQRERERAAERAAEERKARKSEGGRAAA